MRSSLSVGELLKRVDQLRSCIEICVHSSVFEKARSGRNSKGWGEIHTATFLGQINDKNQVFERCENRLFVFVPVGASQSYQRHYN